MISGIRYTLEGLNHAKLMNDLTKSGVRIKKVDKTAQNKISFTVPAKDGEKVVDYIQKKCYNILASRPVGLKSVSALIKAHLVAALAVVLAFLALFVAGNFCFSIKIETTKDAENVKALLSEYGVKIGRNLSTLNYDSLENYLVNNIDGISYAIIDIRGSTLTVKLIDSVTTGEVVDYTKRRDVVATQNGVITRIVCRSGTPRVKPGDTVKTGQVLIAGVKTYPDGSTEPVRAEGEVYATVTCGYSVEFSPVGVEYVRTGQTQTQVILYLFECAAKSKSEPKFARYETEKEYYTLFPLAIKVEFLTLYELEAKVVSYTFNERYPVLVAEAEKQARQNADFEVKEVLTGQSGDIITVTVSGEKVISD